MSQTKNSKIILVLLVTALFVGTATVPSNHTTTEISISPVSSGPKPVKNSSIIFMNDTDIDDYDFPGDGSAENPWRFENYTLEFSFNSSTVGIHVENITEHLIIRNLTLTNNNSEVFGTGIRILADNVVIENVTIENLFDGIHLEGDNLRVNHTIVNAQNSGIIAAECNSLNITSTNVTGASHGAYFESCNQTLISTNRFKTGTTGIEMYVCTNFEISNNFIEQYTEKGLLIVETSLKSSSLNLVTRNRFMQNEVQAFVVTDSINTQFYDESTKEGNYWSDWRGWGKYKVQSDVFDLYPMKLLNIEGDIELAKQYPFKFWFWIFAPTIIVLGAVAYFFYWKLIIQPTKE